ncbi:MAG: type II toxin-antitoxin system RelE/ParE family toxin [Micrococcales bacterium]|nr:type II toxin-antitoxin system RelE/ParE family toxin [Micrococcales bacterium]
MGLTLSIHPFVEGDLVEAVDYYSQFDSGLPGRFREDVKMSTDSILLFPFMGSAVFDDYRHLVLRVFPYMVVYRVAEPVVRVLAVVHTHRDPVLVEQVVRGRSG